MSAHDRMEKFIILKLTTTWTQAKIAKELRVSENTVSSYKTRPDYKETFNRLAVEVFDDLRAPALARLRMLLKSDNEQIVMQAIKTILEYTVSKATDNVNISGNINADVTDPFKNMSREDLRKVLRDG